ncbi:PP2C family serine/threonine-protein phosphatase [Herbiconiux sp. L3-i23]|uniref:PP2C family protein-serine/threonine phosphatase n=1 Tax=Herbiconiux sp. L3-i23 TaxID=2905871 RepID=UPI00205E539A|nr:protein phosphatase 2C domain-containing protein [Herbiconiux sp. L3-i23]BDI22025.1 serine/threonine protein phosphatase [Herbiconiux sp. L3-i23]
MTQIGRSNPGYTVSVPRRPDIEITLSWSAVTDVGRKRAVNEDSFVAQSPLFAVADGMGGHSAGDLASTAVVTRLAEVIEADFIDPDVVEHALNTAALDIERVSGRSALGTGTTVTGAALTLVGSDPYWAVFNIGDSRVYQLRGRLFEQVTVDHSVVQELVDSGAITKEQAEHHPDSNVITRAIGFNELPAPDLWMIPVTEGLRLMICSDGLTKELSDEDIRQQLVAGAPSRETATALVDAALGRGGRDNVTVLVVDVVATTGDFDLDQTVPRRGTGRHS